MKIAIIGCGGQGTLLACLLAKEEDIEQLILADRDASSAKRAEGVVKAISTEVELKIEQLDASKKEDVARVAKGADIIFNATFPEFNIPVMEACLDVGAHYLDLLAYPFKLPGIPEHGTIDAQLELDDKFKAAGLTALVSMGVSPGWTDIAARYIIDQLDTVDTVMLRIGGRYDSKELIAPFASEVLMGEWFGAPYPICVDNGEIKEVDLLESAEPYQFPEPLGWLTVYTVTLHTEVRTIPEFVGKPVKHIELKNAVDIGKWAMKDVWVEAIRKQTAKYPEREMIKMTELFGKSFIQPADTREAYDKGIITGGRCGFCVEVTGQKDGRRMCHTVCRVVTNVDAQKRVAWAGDGNYVTVVPSLVTVLMIGSGEITKRGVIGGAALDNPETILKRVNEYGGITTEKIERQLF